ncbi:MAG: DUF362 domain-containing protein [Desulfuromonadales bacterium]|nr:DUF362 domain-containing protein [Desulfuromonadales bacterium]NIR34385.1 DUF362 domain-containing protein [Desulfuromonadales bacterium]NIS44351.1 DUF362 domain-containing protein [Desulfuromonadales bacterium]
MSSACHIESFSSYAESIPRALDAVGAAEVLARQERVIVKPNLVNASPPPITLPVEAAEALIGFIRSCSDAEIVIAEGTGERHLETDEIFRTHRYDTLAERVGAELVDLNHAPVAQLENPGCDVFPTFMMPKLVMEGFLISAAVLKAHSLADVTLSMKNLIGCAPPAYYQQGGHWKKSAFHARMHEAIFDLNRYRRPDLALVDGAVGMAEHHLGGPACDPPVGKIVAGFDPVAVDAAGAGLLGFDWRSVEHISMADGVLGQAD